MTDLCAIQGQLVDVRNVGTHKCVKLTIHVPAEYAPRVFEAFGWPTGVDPVPVALARLNTNGKETLDTPIGPATPAPSADNATARAPSDTRLAKQAGRFCKDPAFQAFLYEHDMAIDRSEASAATAVRLICHVDSRSKILPGTAAAEEWERLHSKFLASELTA